MKKRMSLLLAAALLTGTLAGCGGGSSSSGTTTTAGAADGSATTAGDSGTSQADASGDRVTIKFVNGYTGGDGPFITKMVDGFNESQSKYFVDMLITDDHYTKFKSDHFDLVIMHADWLSTYVPDGLLRPLDDLYDKAGLSLDQWSDVAETYVKIDDQLWAFPLDNYAYIMFYNKQYVDTPPATYEELKALSEKLDSENTNIWAMGIPLSGETQWTYMSTLAQFDYNYEGDGYLDFNSMEAAEILMNIHKWIYEDGISPANLGVDDHCNLFISTADENTMQTVLSLTGPWDYSNFVAVLGDDLGVAPIPVFGNHQAVNGSGHNISVAADCEDPEVLDGIVEFVKYLYTPEVLLNWADSGQAPNFKAAMEVIKQEPEKYATAVNTYEIIDDIKILPSFYNVRSQVTNMTEVVWTELVTNPDLTAEDLLPLLEKATKYSKEMSEE